MNPWTSQTVCRRGGKLEWSVGGRSRLSVAGDAREHADVSAQRPIHRPALGSRGGYMLHAPAWKARLSRSVARSATSDCDWHARCNSFAG